MYVSPTFVQLTTQQPFSRFRWFLLQCIAFMGGKCLLDVLSTSECRLSRYIDYWLLVIGNLFFSVLFEIFRYLAHKRCMHRQIDISWYLSHFHIYRSRYWLLIIGYWEYCTAHKSKPVQPISVILASMYCFQLWQVPFGGLEHIRISVINIYRLLIIGDWKSIFFSFIRNIQIFIAQTMHASANRYFMLFIPFSYL